MELWKILLSKWYLIWYNWWVDIVKEAKKQQKWGKRPAKYSICKDSLVGIYYVYRTERRLLSLEWRGRGCEEMKRWCKEVIKDQTFPLTSGLLRIWFLTLRTARSHWNSSHTVVKYHVIKILKRTSDSSMEKKAGDGNFSPLLMEYKIVRSLLKSLSVS